MAQKQIIAPKTVDQQLADHLGKAEEHLIAAVELFGRRSAPNRSSDYVTRLTRHQEGVTSLFREELVRMRGPLKVRVKKGRK